MLIGNKELNNKLWRSNNNMQDRYAGDIGDFGKFGLLKAIEETGFKVGVNWYLTKPINIKEQNSNDGKHKIKEDYKQCDAELFDILTKVFNLKEKRSVKAIEKKSPLKKAIYYAEPINYDDREKWHKEALTKFKTCKVKVAFLDPDNGLEVKSAKNSNKKLTKYVLMKEINEYIKEDISVVFYNHRQRRNKDEYFKELFDKVKKATKMFPFSISFHKGTVRDYIIMPINKEHKDKLKKAINKMNCLESKWHEKGLCQIDYE